MSFIITCFLEEHKFEHIEGWNHAFAAHKHVEIDISETSDLLLDDLALFETVEVKEDIIKSELKPWE